MSDMAYRLNVPVTAVEGTCAELEPLVRTDCEHVMVESVKHALHGEGTVLRLYECFGQRGRVRLQLGWNVKSVHRISLMEDLEEAVPVSGDRVEFEIRPYEIVSLLAE